jgi:membrane protein DedA with SNARE-associated domain
MPDGGLMTGPGLLAFPGAGLFQAVERFAEDAAGYGYWAVMLVVAGDGVFPILPGETAIVAAAVLAADGGLSLPLVILAGAVGAVIGDSTAYWIGRGGRGPIRRWIVRMAGEDRLIAAERMVRRHGAVLVFVGRFLPGLRIAINVSCGAGQMGYRRFLFFDALGGLVWATQAALIGFFLGRAFADQPWVAFLVAFAVTAAVAGVVAWRERVRVRRGPLAARETPPSEEGEESARAPSGAGRG